MALRPPLARLDPEARNTLQQVRFQFVRWLSRGLAPIRLALFRMRRDRRRWLHVGCGDIRLPGWINADVHPRAELIVDLRKRLPFGTGSLERIYCEHVIEHLTCAEAVGFFREAHRTLAEGGVLRIAMPDLGDLISAYQEDWRSLDWLSWPEFEFIQTRAEMLNIAFRWWGHRYLYDREELERRLGEATFSRLVFCSRGESRHAELRGLERREDSKLVVEATR